MSDTPVGSLSLEQDYDSQVPPETPPAADPAVPPPFPVEEPEPEGTVEIPTGKVVPLAALQSERTAKQQEREARQKLEAEIEPLRAKAAKADQIAQEWQAVQPLIQQLKNQPPPPVEKSAGPLTPQDAIEYAKDLDLYKADGTPDVERAQRLATRQQVIAEQQARAMVAPLHQQTAQQQAAVMRSQLGQIKDAQGQTVSQSFIDQMFAVVPPEMAAREDVATVLYYAAKGMEAHAGKAAPVAPPPPVHTESLGGGVPPKTEINALDRRVIDASDMTEKEFTSIAGRFKPGQRNVLE